MAKQQTLIIFLLFACGIVQAESTQKNYDNHASIEETTGFLSGAVIGGFAAGPPGAIFAASIGAILGENWNSNEREKDNLEISLHETNLLLTAANMELNSIQKQYEIVQSELDQYKNSPATLLPASINIRADMNCCDDTTTSIHFRSGQSNIEPHYEEQLKSIANLVKKMIHVRVEITGYADRNGDTNTNFDLSNRRTKSVKSFFNREGIENTSIVTVAYGETRPVQATQNFESDFFDRRVMVRLRNKDRSMLTQTPEN